MHTMLFTLGKNALQPNLLIIAYSLMYTMIELKSYGEIHSESTENLKISKSVLELATPG